MKRIAARVLAGLVGVLGMAGVAPVAVAAAAGVSPSLTLSQAATQAASTQPLGADITLGYSTSGDSVKDMALTLPPGLLADAAMDGGRCLKTTTLASACQVASGTVKATATAVVLPVTVTVPISLYLVPPPNRGDLAGLQIVANDPPLVTGPLGGPADVVVNPPDAHVTITFTSIPNMAPVLGAVPVPISVQQIQTTLSGLRLPAKCSGLPPFGVSVTTYDGASATASRPVTVTGCSNLALTPTFRVSAVRDATNNGVQVTTDLAQPQPASAPFQATARTVVLSLPPTVLGPNVVGALSTLCTQPAPYRGCVPVGSATSTSPLYPTALTGNAFLVGSLAAPNIAIVFPPPFSLTLAGSVDIATGATTFTGVPDIPLSDLKVSLFGGQDAVFSASCNPSSGTASATLTSQEGDQTATSRAPFTVSGCPAAGGGTGPGGGSPGGPRGGRGSSPGDQSRGSRSGRPSVRSASISRLGSGLALLRLTVLRGHNAPELRSVALELPRGLSFRPGRAVMAVHISGARARYARLVHGRLLIVLSRPVNTLTVRVQGLRETATLERDAKHHRLHSLVLAVGITDASGIGTLLRVTVRALHP
jgi:hypothetical protein